ncbi:hypothetical protein EDD21DRAFT_167596 [Dissophora ornata]|nr:hypothetical protein EDD21DRAFT_167596 [Dissophora ornata]
MAAWPRHKEKKGKKNCSTAPILSVCLSFRSQQGAPPMWPTGHRTSALPRSHLMHSGLLEKTMINVDEDRKDETAIYLLLFTLGKARGSVTALFLAIMPRILFPPRPPRPSLRSLTPTLSLFVPPVPPVPPPGFASLLQLPMFLFKDSVADPFSVKQATTHSTRKGV